MVFESFVREMRDLVFGLHQIPGRVRLRLRRVLGRSKVTVIRPSALPQSLDGRVDPEVWNASYASSEEFKKGVNAHFWADVATFERSLVPPGSFFELVGYCAVCRRDSKFYGDFRYSDGQTPNWREHLYCRYCKLPNRVRAVIDILENDFVIPQSAAVYVTE